MIVPLSLHVNISATEAGKVPRFGATSDMLEVKLRRDVTELGLAASRSPANQYGNGHEMRQQLGFPAPQAKTHLDNGLAIDTR